jgi:hypothetical protein
VAIEEQFWAQKKQQWRAAHMEKRRKKEWIGADFNNPNTELDDEDLRWLDYIFLAFQESTDEE